MALFIGKNIHRLDRIDSTNNYLRRMLDDQLENAIHEGTIVLAAEQYEGRGQRGSRWETEPGKNLTFSVLLKPHFLRAEQQFYLSKMVSLAVTDLLESVTGMPFFIKWPNDILCNDKKISGILIENSIRKGKVHYCIAGVGINVNQQHFEGVPGAVSMTALTKRKYKTDSLLNTFYGFLEKRYLMLRDGKNHLLDEAYHERLYRYSEMQTFKRKDGTLFKARIKGVAKNGKLKLGIGEDEVLFDFKEVKYVIGD